MLTDADDLRKPENRRETFLRFYDFHTRWGAHPGGVYFLIPWLRSTLDWDDEETLWFCFINGNTQNPITSLILHAAGSTPSTADASVAEWRARYASLAFDTDRRYHKKSFDVAVASYVDLLGDRTQAAFWTDRQAAGWDSMWSSATAISTFGRLSAWSYLEYVMIAGYGCDADTLLVGDHAGSRSHRNGLCIVDGLDHLDWHASNPTFDGVYDPDVIDHLASVGEDLLVSARARAAGEAHLPDLTRLTLESALCTYKSWHRPNRRYPGVYLDMLRDRIVQADDRHADVDAELWWQARSDCLPVALRLEDRPGDPGVGPDKQNWYRVTGQQHTLQLEWPQMRCELDRQMDAQQLGVFR